MVTAADRLARDGFAVLAPEPGVACWAAAARQAAVSVLADPAMRDRWLRHGETWFVGVDALDTGSDGSIGGVALTGAWQDVASWAGRWHPAQLSAVFPGYPGRDAAESEAAHRFRARHDAAHVDGLLPLGPGRRRYLREPHAFILGLPLNDAAPGASPLVVWQGSHAVIAAALAARLRGVAPDRWADEDLTDVYHAARRRVLETCPRRELPLRPGQSVVVHRQAVHGVAPWRPGAWIDGPARMMAYFRPVLDDPAGWL